jgi:hypothetical protein
VAVEAFTGLKQSKVKKEMTVIEIEDKECEKQSWEKDVDNLSDLEKLYRWQNQARKKFKLEV